MAFVPTITIALLVLATGAADMAPSAARVVWWIAAVGHLAATVWALSTWAAREDIGTGQVTPAWFIPVVGNVVTPLAAPEFGSAEFGWFSFGVGITFWIALLPLVFQRVLLTRPGLPAGLLPTYAIFIAPPSVALLSWQALTHHLNDAPARVLYAAAMFFVVLLAASWKQLIRVPFGMSYWAYTFPLAAGATAAVAVAGALPGAGYDAVAVLLLIVATAVALGVLARTVIAWLHGRLLLPEP